jgi:hypothetical protein
MVGGRRLVSPRLAHPGPAECVAKLGGHPGRPGDGLARPGRKVLDMGQPARVRALPEHAEGAVGGLGAPIPGWDAPRRGLPGGGAGRRTARRSWRIRVNRWLVRDERLDRWH